MFQKSGAKEDSVFKAQIFAMFLHLISRQFFINTDHRSTTKHPVLVLVRSIAEGSIANVIFNYNGSCHKAC
jgi:hypothetical protein